MDSLASADSLSSSKGTERRADNYFVIIDNGFIFSARARVCVCVFMRSVCRAARQMARPTPQSKQIVVRLTVASISWLIASRPGWIGCIIPPPYPSSLPPPPAPTPEPCPFMMDISIDLFRFRLSASPSSSPNNSNDNDNSLINQ